MTTTSPPVDAPRGCAPDGAGESGLWQLQRWDEGLRELTSGLETEPPGAADG